MTIRTLSALLPAALFVLTVLAVQAPAHADESTNQLTVEQAAAPATGDVQGSYTPIEESLGD